jgi:quercetin dioxygenase-like cupin family protein
MGYLREVNFDEYDLHQYGAQFLYVGESAVVIGSNVPAGAAAPPQHVHPIDQLYYVVTGEMQLQLGSERHVVGADTLVYIPAGTAHHNWNEADTDEFHFEVLAPTPPRNTPLMSPTDETTLADTPYRITALTADWPDGAPAGFAKQKLLGRDHGSEHMALYVASVESGSAGPTTHIHSYDQFFYVLEGTMTLQIGLDRYTAGPHTLAVLPAGVPHAQWNEGPDIERHITLLAPEPELGPEWGTRGVALLASDIA